FPEELLVGVGARDHGRLPRGHAVEHERRDQRHELAVGAVAGGLVEVALVAARRSGPHQRASTPRPAKPSATTRSAGGGNPLEHRAAERRRSTGPAPRAQSTTPPRAPYRSGTKR